jgi:hypothetical protein
MEWTASLREEMPTAPAIGLSKLPLAIGVEAHFRAYGIAVTGRANQSDLQPFIIVTVIAKE